MNIHRFWKLEFWFLLTLKFWLIHDVTIHVPYWMTQISKFLGVSNSKFPHDSLRLGYISQIQRLQKILRLVDFSPQWWFNESEIYTSEFCWLSSFECLMMLQFMFHVKWCRSQICWQLVPSARSNCYFSWDIFLCFNSGTKF